MALDEDDEATAGAIRAIVRNLPSDARNAVLADAALNTTPEVWGVIKDIVNADRINGNDKEWRK